MSFSAGLLFIALTVAQVTCEAIEVDITRNVDTRRDTRVVSGWAAHPGQHPHQANIRMVNSIGAVGSCDASIVHTSWALSAAHCLVNQVTLVVRAGLVNLTEPEYIAETTTFFMHPQYNPEQSAIVQGTDIALIKLETPVTLSNHLQPIRVQSEADGFRNYHEEIVYTSGFGRTWTGGSTSERLNWVFLTAISNEQCRSIFGDSVKETTICARFYNVTSQSICQGDDGGPLVYKGEDGIPTLIGISSFVLGTNYGGCHSGQPAGFVRTGPFIPWMREVTQVDLDKPETTTEPLTTTEDPTTEFSTTENTSTEPSTTEEPTAPERTTTEAPIDIESTEEPASSEDSDENSDEGDDASDSDDSDDSEEDKELAEILKRLQVEVSVKVKLDKLKKPCKKKRCPRKHKNHVDAE